VSLPARIAALLVAFAAVVGGAVFIVFHYIGGYGGTLPTVNYLPMAHAGQVNVVLQEDPQNNSASRPAWVSYYVQDPSTHQWVHTTLFSVPANTRVNMTIKGYDGCTPLRNNFWGLIQGTIGNSVSVQQFKNTNQPLAPARTMSVINSWSSCNVGHTFAIPSMGVFVPVASPNAYNNGNKSGLCGVSPCTSGPYSLEKFSFRTPAHGGTLRWQCFIPCGGGFLDGNGGPMQTLGYMAGEIQVVS
jgi:hypothetical protein